MAKSSGNSPKGARSQRPRKVVPVAPSHEGPGLFGSLPDVLEPQPIHQTGIEPIWTQHKAQVIAKYIYLFTIITHHGAYIDGFAGPKRRDLADSWAAELVINAEPRRLREVFLCDLDSEKVAALEQLVARQPDRADRSYEVLRGDFNDKVANILASGKIRETTATFCLIDQFAIECHWKTLQALARHKPAGSRKIELFYFFPTGWLARSLKGHTVNTHLPDLWWGSDSWKELMAPGGNRLLTAMTERFRDELGYRFVRAYPIYEKENGEGRTMFHMIHASDHPEAHKLMARAHRNVVKEPESQEQLELELSRIDP